jgi:hypothetical protein
MSRYDARALDPVAPKSSSDSKRCDCANRVVRYKAPGFAEKYLLNALNSGAFSYE